MGTPNHSLSEVFTTKTTLYDFWGTVRLPYDVDIMIHGSLRLMRQYIAGVVKYCEKKGNEALWKKLNCIKKREMLHVHYLW